MIRTKRKKRKQRILTALLAAVLMCSMLPEISAQAVSAVEYDESFVNFSCSITGAVTDGELTLTASCQSYYPQTGDIIYQWSQKAPGGSWSDIPGADSSVYRAGSVSGKQDYQYRCVAKVEHKVSWDMIRDAFHAFLHRNSLPDRNSNSWVDAVNNGTVRSQMDSYFSLLVSGAGVSDIDGSRGFVNDAAAVAAAMVISAEYLECGITGKDWGGKAYYYRYTDGDGKLQGYKKPQDNNNNYMNKSSVPAANEGQSTPDNPYYSSGFINAEYQETSVVWDGFPHTPRQFINDCYLFLLGRTPSADEISRWYSVYDAWSGYTGTANLPIGVLAEGRYPVAGKYVYNGGMLAVINGIASSEECGNYMAAVYYYDKEQGIFPSAIGSFTRTAAAVSNSYSVPEPANHTVIVQKEDGSISNVSGGGLYQEGAAVTVSAIAKEGYVFDRWTVSSREVIFDDEGASCTTFIMPDHDVTVKAAGKDAEKPGISIAITSPGGFSGGNIWTNQTVTITAAAGDTGSGINEGSYQWTTDGSSWSGQGSAVTKTLTVTGTYTVKAKVKDKAGNQSADSNSITVKIDKQAPEVSLSASPMSWTNGGVTLTADGEDTGGSGLHVRAYSWDNGATWTASRQKTVSGNGAYTVKVRDSAGNIGSRTITVANIDRAAPVISGYDVLESLPRFTDSGQTDRWLDRNSEQSDMQLRVTDVGQSGTQSDASGIKDIVVSITNYDSGLTGSWSWSGGMEETYTDPAGNVYTRGRTAVENEPSLRINLWEERELLYGDYRFVATAHDFAGNEFQTCVDTTEFSLDVGIQRMLEPHDTDFQQGESGILSIKAGGHVDEIRITFPEIIDMDRYKTDSSYETASYGTKSVSRQCLTYGYDAPQYVENAAVQFMVPLYVPEQNYKIIVSIVKDGRQLQSKEVSFNVTDTVLDDTRTRLR